MKSYGDIETWSRAVLDANNLEDVALYPGPDLPDIPDRYVVWTRYGGPGFDGGEHALDNISWQARCVGLQDDYTSAETVADVIDLALTSLPSGQVGSTHVVQVQRVGGAPNPLMKDDADRTHFVCSYNIEQSSALPTH